MLKYQIVESDEHGNEEVLLTVNTAAFATDTVQSMRELNPAMDLRVKTVEA